MLKVLMFFMISATQQILGEGTSDPIKDSQEQLKIIEQNKNDLDKAKNIIDATFPNSLVVYINLGRADGHDLEASATEQLGYAVFPNIKVCNVSKADIKKPNISKKEAVESVFKTTEKCLDEIQFEDKYQHIHISFLHGLSSAPTYNDKMELIADQKIKNLLKTKYEENQIFIYKIDINHQKTSVLGFLKENEYSDLIEYVNDYIADRSKKAKISFSTPACGIGSTKLSYNSAKLNEKNPKSFGSNIATKLLNNRQNKKKSQIPFIISDASKNYTSHPSDILRKTNEIISQNPKLQFGELVPNVAFVSLDNMLKPIYFIDDYNAKEYGFASVKQLNKISTGEIKIQPNERDYPNYDKKFFEDCSISREGNKSILPKEGNFKNAAVHKDLINNYQYGQKLQINLPEHKIQEEEKKIN